MHNFPQIVSFQTLSKLINPNSKIICTFSGGLDGAFTLEYLSKLKSLNICALNVKIDDDNTESRAGKEFCDILNIQYRLEDKREEFAQEYVFPAIAACSTYLGNYPICSSLSRPLIAKTAYDLAAREGYDIIIHTSNRTQNSLRRFNGALMQLGFSGIFGSPFESSSISREEKMNALSKYGLNSLSERVYSIDTNIWGREFEYGDLDDPENIKVNEELYLWTHKSKCKDTATDIKLKFENGFPTEVNGVKLKLVELIKYLNITIGAYGLGRYIGLEECKDGVKVQETREMPAAFILFDAHRRLESAVLPSECVREKLNNEQLWVREAIEGRWFGPLWNAANAFIQSFNPLINGEVTYKVQPNKLTVNSIKADTPLYIRDRSIYEKELYTF